MDLREIYEAADKLAKKIEKDKISTMIACSCSDVFEDVFEKYKNAVEKYAAWMREIRSAKKDNIPNWKAAESACYRVISGATSIYYPYVAHCCITPKENGGGTYDWVNNYYCSDDHYADDEYLLMVNAMNNRNSRLKAETLAVQKRLENIAKTHNLNSVEGLRDPNGEDTVDEVIVEENENGDLEISVSFSDCDAAIYGGDEAENFKANPRLEITRDKIGFAKEMTLQEIIDSQSDEFEKQIEEAQEEEWEAICEKIAERETERSLMNWGRI